MPFLIPAIAVIAGALVWNSIDDTVIDPITGSGSGINPIVYVALGAGLALLAKKKGWI